MAPYKPAPLWTAVYPPNPPRNISIDNHTWEHIVSAINTHMTALNDERFALPRCLAIITIIMIGTVVPRDDADEGVSSFKFLPLIIGPIVIFFLVLSKVNRVKNLGQIAEMYQKIRGPSSPVADTIRVRYMDNTLEAQNSVSIAGVVRWIEIEDLNQRPSGYKP